MITRRFSHLSREEKIAGTVLGALGAAAPNGIFEEQLIDVVRIGLVPDVSVAELKAELITCEACGWARSTTEEKGVLWHGTEAAAAARACFVAALGIETAELQLLKAQTDLAELRSNRPFESDAIERRELLVKVLEVDLKAAQVFAPKVIT